MIVLTGASGGIGKEMLRGLSEIDSVIGIYNKSTPSEDIFEKISLQQFDLTNEEDIDIFVEKNRSVLKDITLVHAAGTAKDSLTINHRKEDWENVVDVNLKANFLLTKALIPLMVKQKWGRLINFSSIRTAKGTVSYATTKHGLLGMSKVLAREYSKFNITSNSFILGAFNTGMFQSLSKKAKEEMIEQIPSKTLGEVDNIVNAIKFVIDSPFVNGSSIIIDGGAST